MKRVLTIAVAVLAISGLTLGLTIGVPRTSSALRPERPHETIYYDSAGNEIGWIYLTCLGSFRANGDTSGDIFTVTYGEPCMDTLEPIVCSDVGLTSVGSCSDWCVSEGYALSYELNLVPDCGGAYKRPTPTPTPSPSPSPSP